MTEKPLKPNLDELDHRLIELLKVNARLPLVNLAKALGCARSTAQLRLKALEDAEVITGYTVGVSSTRGPLARSATGTRPIAVRSKVVTHSV